MCNSEAAMLHVIRTARTSVVFNRFTLDGFVNIVFVIQGRHHGMDMSTSTPLSPQGESGVIATHRSTSLMPTCCIAQYFFLPHTLHPSWEGDPPHIHPHLTPPIVHPTFSTWQSLEETPPIGNPGYTNTGRLYLHETFYVVAEFFNT